MAGGFVAGYQCWPDDKARNESSENLDMLHRKTKPATAQIFTSKLNRLKEIKHGTITIHVQAEEQQRLQAQNKHRERLRLKEQLFNSPVDESKLASYQLLSASDGSHAHLS